MATPQEVIKAFMKSLDNTSLSGTAALDEAVRACSNYSSIQDVIDNMINDCKNSSSATYFLKRYCGIKIYNDDTGAITGSDAGGSVTKTAESVVPENGPASYPQGTSFTVRGLTVIIPERSTLTSAEQNVIQGLFSWWVEESLKLIEESYGFTFTEPGTTVNEITIDFETNSNSKTLAYVRPSKNSAGETSELKLVVNMAHYSSVQSDDVNGEGDTSFYLDRTIAHELTHAVMAANISKFSDLPTFIKEGMAELTHGIDNERASAIMYLASDSSNLEQHLNLNKNTSLFIITSDYAAGYMFLRYLAKQAAGIVDSAAEQEKYNIIELSNDNKTLINYIPGIEIIGSSGNDKIMNDDAPSVTINSGAGDDYIGNDMGASLTAIDAGSGNDSISNYASNSTIDGGAGNDSICNHDESSITAIDAGSGNDTIKNHASKVIINGGDGDNYIVNGADASLTAISAGYGSNYIYNRASSVTIESGGGNDTIANYGKDVIINAGDGNDSIYNNYSDQKNSINAGKGDDIISGYGMRLIQYSDGDGNDTINNFSSADTLQITSGVISGSSIDNSDVLLYVGNGSIRIKNALDQSLNIKGADGNLYTTIVSAQATTPADTTPADTTPADTTPADTTPSSQDTLPPVTIPSGDTTPADTTPADTTPADTTPSSQDTLPPVTIPSGDTTPADTTPADTTPANANPTDTTPAANTNLIIDNSTKSPVTLSADYETADASSRTKAIRIIGNELANTIQGGKGKDTIRGGAGDDSLLGNVGNDKLYGDAGNDTLIGGKGNDTLTGGDGRDVFVYGSGDGKDVITDYTSGQDSIKLTSGTISKVSLSGNDVVLKVGTGSIKVKKAKGKALTIVDSNDISSTVTYTDTLTLTNSNANSIKVTDSLIKTIDASKRTKAIKIIGNSKANTIYGGKGNDTISGGGGNDTFIYSTGSGNDVITDFTAGETIKLKSGTLSKVSISGNDTVLKVGNGSVKLKNAKNKAFTPVDANNKSTSIIYGSNGNDSLLGTAKADSILGNAGADTINGGKGNDTMTGGSGADVFVYKSGDGNDVITDYAAGDRISITSGVYSRSTVGNDVKLSIGSGSILLKNAKNKNISIDGQSDTLSITNSTKSPVTVGSAIKNIDASKRTLAVKITGNALANSIVGGKGADSINGGAGADTIIGGKGNDTLTGGAGADVFVYASGDGNDVITDYTAQDKISITGGTTYTRTTVGNDVRIKVGSGSILLKNAKNKTVNINNNSRNFIEEPWFIDDNNFVANEVDSILKDKNSTENNSYSQIASDGINAELSSNKQTSTAIAYTKMKTE